MSRYPLLDAMRARRQREEGDIAAPHKKRAEISAQVAREERAAREGLERIMQSKVAPRVLDEIGRTMGRELERAIMEAAVKALKVAPETTITVPTGMLMYADPKSMVSRVVDWWKMENAPKMKFRAFKGEMEFRQHVTTVEVSIPEMRYRQMVADEL